MKRLILLSFFLLFASWTQSVLGQSNEDCLTCHSDSTLTMEKNGKVISLPHVGHGYGVPRNWMPQYRAGLIELLRSAAPGPRVAERNR